MAANNSKTFLITGAGSGLGRGLSLHFAKAGHRVIVTDLNLDSARETARLGGANCSAYAVDVTSESSRQTFFSAVQKTTVDVLINNAGFQYMAPLEEFPQAKWDQLINVVLGGSAAMTRGVLPGMRAQNWGRIVNIGSASSLIASPFKSAYIAAKHGLLGFSKSIALETAEQDITINTLCPTFIDTPLMHGQLKDQARLFKIPEDQVMEKVFIGSMPKKALITIEEMAGAVEYLVSHNARNITGQTITIDGGVTAR